MAFEDIAGIRTLWTDYIGGTIAAASGTVLTGLAGYAMARPYTIVGAAIGAGTTIPAGTSMSLKFYVNGTRKGVGTITLTAGAGSRYSEGNGFIFTGPAGSMLSLAVNSVGNTAGVGARYAIYYVHGHKRS